MNSTTKKFIHDLVAEILGLAKNHVIWDYPNAPRPTKPYATLQLFAEVGEAQEDILKTTTVGIYNVVVPVTQTLRVQYFGGTDMDVTDKLNYLARKLETPTYADKCFAKNVAFYNATSVQDLTEIMDDESVDVRSSIDFYVRTTNEILDDLSVIEKVKVDENIYIDDTDILTRQYTIAVETNGGN